MQDQLKNLIRAGYSGLYLVTHEEVRAEAEVKAVADNLKFKLASWAIGDGLLNLSTEPPTQIPGTEDQYSMLDALGQLPEKSIIMAKDLHLFMTGDPPDPVMIRKLKNALLLGKATNRVIVICSCQLKLPAELEKWLTVVEFKLPTEDQLKVVLKGVVASAEIEEPEPGNIQQITRAASGLTTSEAEDAFALSVIEEKAILPEIVARIKADTVKKNGILEIVDSEITLDDIGGLRCMTSWLLRRAAAFTPKAKEYGLPTVKGILVCGIPGTGKSLSAKATASVLKCPLLKLDAGRLFGSLVGQSESNMRTAIQTAEAVAPCVLQVEEIEKGFSGSKSSGSTDGGTSSRVLGTFLQWMQDKTAQVFVFATANDITQLPPELLRKGRFDELFFVDLPTRREREAIFKIHITKRGRKPSKFNLDDLSGLTDGFTGAEIEAVFNDALFSAFDEDKEPNMGHVTEAIANTVPLSKTMAAQIDSLRSWANGRARMASAPDAVTDIMPKGRKLAA